MSKSLAEAVAELRRHPQRLVRARVDDLEVELRAVGGSRHPERLGTYLAALGPWKGESSDELLARRAREVLAAHVVGARVPVVAQAPLRARDRRVGAAVCAAGGATPAGCGLDSIVERSTPFRKG